MAYTFEQIFAADPSSPGNVAVNGVVTIFAPGDASKTPLPLTSVNGMALANPIEVNAQGFGPAFIAPIDRVAWEGGGYTGFLTSYDGMKEEAVAARTSANAAQLAAEEAARNSAAPTQEAIATALTAAGIARDAVAVIVAAGTANLALKPDSGTQAVGKGELAIKVRDYGVRADGVTNDASALLKAASDAVSNGVALQLPSESEIYIGSKVAFPAGLKIIANGATLRWDKDGDFACVFSSNTTSSGLLRIKVRGGEQINTRGLALLGDNINIETLEILADTPIIDPSGGTVSNNSTGLLITGTNIRVGRLAIKNFRNHVNIIRSTNVAIDQIRCDTYQRAVWGSDVVDLWINGGKMFNVAPGAAKITGNDAVLLEASSNGATRSVYLTNITAENALVSTYRVGGAYSVEDIWFTNCIARNTGGNGFKVLGTGQNLHRNINFINCTAEDCGDEDNGDPGSNNENGFLIQKVDGANLISPTVKKRTKRFSAYSGIRVTSSKNIATSNVSITDTRSHGYHIDNALTGELQNIRTTGGTIERAGEAGIRLDYTSVNASDIVVAGRVSVKNCMGSTVHITNQGGGGLRSCSVEIYATSNGAAMGEGSLSSALLDVLTDTPPVGTFANGSIWTDRAQGKRFIRKATVWTEM